jgi:hypothetical protein
MGPNFNCVNPAPGRLLDDWPLPIQLAELTSYQKRPAGAPWIDPPEPGPPGP